ncbi:DNA primase isoform 3 [Tripterygium wilfordii]|uniref:DNA primase isoform 3 n=1 Tax=Tripterygium wilfordii TaxID=458696 RepID=A0A7J7CJH6_TRIWF|nr:DNA primase isoform 3 [Tripterygium wilfordii]
MGKEEVGNGRYDMLIDGCQPESFNNAFELENARREKCPFKIDIGPVYSVDEPSFLKFYQKCSMLQPVKRHAYAQSGDNVFTPVERELVFDVDITDYDDVRYCCSGADVYTKCWPLMTVAIKVINTSLRENGRRVGDPPVQKKTLMSFDGSKLSKCCNQEDKLLEELNKAGTRGDPDNELDGTSHGKSIRFFRSSFLQPLLRSCKEELENSYNLKMQHSKKFTELVMLYFLFCGA